MPLDLLLILLSQQHLQILLSALWRLLLDLHQEKLVLEAIEGFPENASYPECGQRLDRLLLNPIPSLAKVNPWGFSLVRSSKCLKLTKHNA